MELMPDPNAVQKYAYKLDAAAGADADIAIAAVAGEHHVIDSIHYSYDVNHSGGDCYLSVTFGSTVVLKIEDYQAYGNAKDMRFPRGLYTGTKNEAVAIKLNGLAGVTGKVNCTYR
ncbi:MAG: hypothetical protein ACYSWU_02175 [Planctomycetota bacterium]|jgi:hypothetical protein